MNPVIAKIAIAFASLVAAFVFGVMYEHSKFTEYKGEVKGAATVQTEVAKAADTKNEGDAHASQKDYEQAIKSLDAYYRAHPIIRVQHDGACPVSEAAGNTQGANATAPGLYASPYSPRDTEVIAARLYELQQRLIAGGVSVK